MTISSIILCIAFGCMAYGVQTDILERRYPRVVFFSTVILGFIYAYLNQFLLVALLSFIIFTVFGIWASDKHLIANGDLWCLSSLFLFIDITDIQSTVTLIISLLVWGVIVGAFYKRNVIQDYKKGFLQLKMMLYKVYFETDFKNIDKEESIPFTLILVGAFMTTMVLKVVFRL